MVLAYGHEARELEPVKSIYVISIYVYHRQHPSPDPFIGFLRRRLHVTLHLASIGYSEASALNKLKTSPLPLLPPFIPHPPLFTPSDYIDTNHKPPSQPTPSPPDG